MPSALLTWTIQRPLFGNWIAKVPTKKNGKPRPSAKAAIAIAPRGALRVCAIQVRIPVSTGPVQGDAIRPQARPSRNAPLCPIPPSSARRLVNRAGSANSNAPNSDAASARNSTDTPTTTQRFCSAAPNTEPDSPASTPIGTNIATMPSTNDSESAAPSQRLLT